MSYLSIAGLAKAHRLSAPHFARASLSALLVTGLLGFSCASPDVNIPSLEGVGKKQTNPGAQPSEADAGPDGHANNDAGSAMQPVVLRFAARVGEEPFACGQHYAGLGSSDTLAEPSDLRFFVHDVRLIDEMGREVAVRLEERRPYQTAEVALLDFENATGGCLRGDPPMNVQIFGSVPKGQYDGLRITIGVPESLNHADPATAVEPLQAGGMSWGWLLGYKFLVAEMAQVSAAGHSKTPADSAGEYGEESDGHHQYSSTTPNQGADAGVHSGPDHPVTDDVGAEAKTGHSHGDSGATGLGFGVLHVGSTACSGSPGAGEVSCKRSNRAQIELQDFDIDRDVVVVDVAALFTESDLQQGVSCHSSDSSCAPLFDGLGLSYPEGLPTHKQRTFRRESKP